VSHRPLVFVSGLAAGDYLLWNWSLNSNQDVLALIAGLTLPPLAVAALWLLALSLARLLGAVARLLPSLRTRRRRIRASARAPRHGAGIDPVAAAQAQDPTTGGSPSRKLAA
jgi:hypothetical protein